MTPGWEALTQAVAEARALITSAAPNGEVAAEGEAYVTRLMASALSDATLGHLLHEDGLFRPLPTRGGPNPDYIMRHAPIDASRLYRLEGCLNGSERVGIGIYAFDANAAPIEMGYAVFNAANCAADGAFSLNIGAGLEGPGTLAIRPEARVVLARILHRDPSAVPARLRLTGGAPARGLTLVTGTNDGALSFAARSIANGAREYLKWTKAVLAHPNAFASAPPELAETVQGDPDTLYFLGSFDLADGEWLEITMAAHVSGYWSVHAYNFWFEHLQTPGVHDRNAKPDRDGVVRIGVGPDVPASMSNRVNTLGRRRGSLICRIIGTGACPSARVRRQ